MIKKFEIKVNGKVHFISIFIFSWINASLYIYEQQNLHIELTCDKQIWLQNYITETPPERSHKYVHIAIWCICCNVYLMGWIRNYKIRYLVTTLIYEYYHHSIYPTCSLDIILNSHITTVLAPHLTVISFFAFLLVYKDVTT